MARHPGRAMACQTLSAQLLQPQKQLFITGEVLSEAGNGLPPLGSSGMPSTTEGVPPSNRSNVLAHVAPYIHTVGRQRDPLRQVSQPHPRWGICIRRHFLITSCSHRRCLIVFTVFRGAANNSGGGRARRAFLTLRKGRRAQSSLMCRSRRIARLALWVWPRTPVP